jgi:exodeoxyribonuclease VII large subunit
VAHLSLKTPTAVAAFLIYRQAGELALLEDLRRRIPQSVRTRLLQEHHRMDLVGERLPAAARRHFERLHHRLELTAQRLRSLDPQLLLERGYSITTCAGRLVRDVSDLREGEIVTTRLASGEIYSTVNTVVTIDR